VLRYLLFQIGTQIAIALLIIGCITLLKNYVPTDVSVTAMAFLTATSIIFGFVTLGFSIPFNELRQQQRMVSDLIKELLGLYDNARKDKQFASKRIRWNTRVGKWGFQGFGVEAYAEEALRSACRYLLTNVRNVIDATRHSIYAWVTPALVSLIVSIATSILTFFPLVNPETTLSISLFTLIFGASVSVFGWLETNRKLSEINDSVFNMRHLIMGGVYEFDPYAEIY